MSDKPRCTHCRNDDERLLEKVSRPIWASRGNELWYCKVCDKTFLLEKPGPSASL